MILLGMCLAFADAQSAFEQGVQAIRAEDAVSAEQSFLETLEQGGIDPSVYHGLGNALFRQGKTGEAVAAWQRGLLLEPEHSDLSYNLEYFRGEQADDYQAFPVPKFTQNRMWFGLSALLGLCLALLLGWPQKRLLWGGSAVFCIGFGLFAVINPQAQAGAIMVLPSVLATSMPEGTGVELFSISAGVDLNILEESEGSYRIELGNGARGWIPKQSVILSDPNSPFERQ